MTSIPIKKGYILIQIIIAFYVNLVKNLEYFNKLLKAIKCAQARAASCSRSVGLGFLQRKGLGKKSEASCEVTDGVRSSAEDCVSSSSPDNRSFAISSCKNSNAVLALEIIPPHNFQRCLFTTLFINIIEVLWYN